MDKLDKEFNKIKDNIIGKSLSDIETLVLLRQRYNMSQEDLALEMNVSRSSLSKWEQKMARGEENYVGILRLKFFWLKKIYGKVPFEVLEELADRSM